MKTLIALIFLLYSVALSSQERITLLFVGDLMQHRAQIDAAHTSVENPIEAIPLSVRPTNICKLSRMPDLMFFSQQTIIVWIAARQDWNEPSHKSTPFPYPMQALTGTPPNVNNAILFSSGKKVSV